MNPYSDEFCRLPVQISPGNFTTTALIVPSHTFSNYTYSPYLRQVILLFDLTNNKSYFKVSEFELECSLYLDETLFHQFLLVYFPVKDMSCCLCFKPFNNYDKTEDFEVAPKVDTIQHTNVKVQSTEKSLLVPEANNEIEITPALPINTDDTKISFCLTPYAAPNRPEPSTAYEKFSFLKMMKQGVTLLKHDRKSGKSTNNVFKISSNGTKLLWFPVEKRMSMKGASDRELPLSELLEVSKLACNSCLHNCYLQVIEGLTAETALKKGSENIPKYSMSLIFVARNLEISAPSEELYSTLLKGFLGFVLKK